MIKKYHRLFESLFTLFEAKDDATVNKLVWLVFFNSLDFERWDFLIDSYFEDRSFGNENLKKQARDLVEKRKIAGCLDNPTKRVSQIVFGFLSYCVENERDLRDHYHGLKSAVQEVYQVKRFLRDKNIKYFPFYAYFALMKVAPFWDELLSTIILFALTRPDAELSQFNERYFDLANKEDSKLAKLNWTSEESLISVKRRIKDILDSNASYEAVERLPYTEILKIGVPFVSYLSFFDSLNRRYGKNIAKLFSGEEQFSPEGAVKKVEYGHLTSKGYRLYYSYNAEDLQKLFKRVKHTPTWCVIKSQSHFSSYSRGGMFVIFIKDGYQKIRQKSLSFDRLDEDPYELSMLAAAFSREGKLLSVTSRTNQEITRTDNRFLEETTGISIAELNVVLEEQRVPFVISSTGELTFVNVEDVSEVIIPEGVKRISSSVFENLPIKKVVFPDSVEEISTDSFLNCKLLEEVVLSKNLRIIDSHAFRGCIRLSKVNLPDSLEEIGDKAFLKCFSLKEVVIPASVMTIGDSVFEDCLGLESFQMLSKSFVEFGEGVLRRCVNLKHAHLAVFYLSSTFSKCSSLETVTFSETVPVERFDSKTFYGCKSLKGFAEGAFDHVLRIPPDAFAHSGVEELKFSRNLKFIDRGAFNSMPRLKKLELDPKSGYSIEGNYLIDKGASEVREILSFGKKEIEIEDTSNFGPGISGDFIEKVVFGVNVTTIPERFFQYNKHLKYVEFKTKEIKIEPFAFNDCTYLKYIKGTNNGVVIGISELTGCTSIEQVDLSDDVVSQNRPIFDDKNNLPSFYTSVNGKTLAFLRPDSKGYFVIPDGVTRVLPASIRWTQPVSRRANMSIIIPKSLKELDKSCYVSSPEGVTKMFLKGPGLENSNKLKHGVQLFPSGKWEISDEGIFVPWGKGVMLSSPSPVGFKGLNSTTKYGGITKDLVVIDSYCFAGTDIESIAIPKSVKKIGVGAFIESKLEHLDMSECSITELSPYLCTSCRMLKEVKFPKNLKTIPKGMFHGCYELKEITIPEGVKIIEDAAFESCSGLERVVFPNSLETIGLAAFEHCPSLKEVVNFHKGIETGDRMRSVLSLTKDEVHFSPKKWISVVNELYEMVK